MTTPSPEGDDERAAAPVQPVVRVRLRPKRWDDKVEMDLPADAASHWDERAWNRC